MRDPRAPALPEYRDLPAPQPNTLTSAIRKLAVAEAAASELVLSLSDVQELMRFFAEVRPHHSATCELVPSADGSFPHVAVGPFEICVQHTPGSSRIALQVLDAATGDLLREMVVPPTHRT